MDKKPLLQWCLAFALLLFVTTVHASKTIWLMQIKSAIGPATADYFIRGLDEAEASSASLVILQIDTPGGLDVAMRDMIKAILASNVPVACYVTPPGARAASAGTYILYACHIAAMAPATNLGAATPIQIGGPAMPAAPDDSDGEGAPAAGQSAMQRKIVNDAVAYIEGLAHKRGRNAEWAVKAVREGASISSEEAFDLKVIDLLADDIPDLLSQIDGTTVEVRDRNVLLATTDVEIIDHAPDWRNEFLAVITNPNVAYILMLVGVYGLIFEFSNPGAAIPGIVGSVSLLLALYAFQLLPVNYVGAVLLILGISLMIAEALVPSFGVMGLGGIIAFVIGSIILMDTDLPDYQIAYSVIGAFALLSGGFFILALGMLLRVRRQQVVTGLEILVGATTSVESVHKGRAAVRLKGELWHVDCDQVLELDDQVRVDSATHIVLQVSKISSD